MKSIWKKLQRWWRGKPYSEWTFKDCMINEASLSPHLTFPYSLTSVCADIANAHPDHPVKTFGLPVFRTYPNLLPPMPRLNEARAKIARCIPHEKTIVICDWMVCPELVTHELKHWLYQEYGHPDWLFPASDPYVDRGQP